jgi:hypothetical protein
MKSPALGGGRPTRGLTDALDGGRNGAPVASNWNNVFLVPDAGARSAAKSPAGSTAGQERFAEMQRNRNAFIKRRGGHILDHMHSAPPPSIVVHDMTGGAAQVTVSRHEATQ